MIEKFTYFWSTVGYYLTWNMQKEKWKFKCKMLVGFFFILIICVIFICWVLCKKTNFFKMSSLLNRYNNILISMNLRKKNGWDMNKTFFVMK